MAESPGDPSAGRVAVELRGITKRFPGVVANSDIHLRVDKGTIHAIVGENGAGKSTLMKILYGLYHPDEGEIRINDRPVTIASPTDAINLGIGMIHQHFMLVPTLTVAENVALGLPSSRGPLTDLDRVSKRIVELANNHGLRMDPSAYIWRLSVGQQQRVEIIKALYRGAALLILDEPTAVLTPQEVDELFVIMHQMVKDGHGLIFISHKLHEVVEISNRITVLLDGENVTNFAPGELTDRMLSYIPEERMRDGMIKNFTIAENMILREHHKQPYSHSGFLNLRDISGHAEELITKFHVKTPSRDTLAKNLSGGNIQKVVLARELSRNPRVILAAQPTRGLDIGATEYVREQLLIQRRQGDRKSVV